MSTKIFKGYEVDNCGRVINTFKGNLDCEYILGPETSSHFTKIVCIRKNDVKVTLSKDDNKNIRHEIYFFKPFTYDIKYSRVYDQSKLPSKYNSIAKQLEEKYNEIYGE